MTTEVTKKATGMEFRKNIEIMFYLGKEEGAFILSQIRRHCWYEFARDGMGWDGMLIMFLFFFFLFGF